MKTERDCLYSRKGNCILADAVNNIFEDIRTDLGSEISDEEIYRIIKNRYPENVAADVVEYKNLVKGSSCKNCPFRKSLNKY